MKTFSAQAYSKFYESSQDGILIMHKSRFIDCNRAILKMLKYKNKKGLLLTHPSQISPEYQPDGQSSFHKAESMIKLCLKTGQNRFEWLHKKSTGEMFWVEIVLTSLDVEGKQYIHASLRDIQDRKRLESENIKKDKEMTRYILENEQYNYAVNNFMIVSKTDTNGLITFANKAFCEISGYAIQELIGKSHNIVRHPDMDSDFFQDLWKNISQGITWNGNIKNKNKDNQTYYVKTVIIPMYDENAEIYEYISIREDITPLIHDRDTAIEDEKSKDLLLSKISHELKTPLNGIQGFANILLKMSQSPEAKSYTDLISKESTALLSLINELLDTAKFKSDHFVLSPCATNLFLFLAYEIKFFKPMMLEKNITFIPEIDYNLPQWVYLDAQRLKQVIHNLINNAIKFTPFNGQVTLSVKYIHTKIEFSVEDSGIGIDKSMQKKIFQAFTQLNDLQEYGGTGLGLNIASSIVRKMNSTLQLNSQLGEGSRFYFRFLPEILNNEVELKDKLSKLTIDTSYLQNDTYNLIKFCNLHKLQTLETANKKDRKSIILLDNINDYKQLTDQESKIILTKNYQKNDCSNRLIATGVNNISLLYEILYGYDVVEYIGTKNKIYFNLHVLVAEDYETNQLLIKSILENLGVIVKIADNGKEGLELCKKHCFDLILADINMPILDGLQMARTLFLENSKVPIYALTADMSMPLQEDFKASHFTGFLHKPIDTSTIITILEALNQTKVQDSEKEDSFKLETLKAELSLPDDVLLKLLNSYLLNSKRSLTQLEKAYTHKNYKKVQEITHKLKGSAGSLLQTQSYNCLNDMENDLLSSSYNKVEEYIKYMQDNLQILEDVLLKQSA